MKNIKDYKCQTCGGQIIINEEKRVCTCESCGNDFDYEYFYDKDLLSSAKRALEIKEYKSANKMFDIYLMENPDSREAFVGKVMSSCRVSSVEEINVNTMSKSLLTADFSNYKNATGADAETVKLCNMAMTNARTVASNNNKAIGFDANIKKHSQKISDLEVAKEEIFIPTKYGGEDVRSFIQSTIVIDAIIAVIAFLAILILDPEVVALGFFVVFVLAGLTLVKLAVTGAFQKLKQLKDLEAQIEAVRNESEENRKNKLAALEEATKASNELAMNIKDIRKWAMS